MDGSDGTHVRLRDWLGLIRFSHTIFALPFAALATAMAFAAPLPDGGQRRTGAGRGGLGGHGRES